MAGNLLHLIRDAEKKAEDVIHNATNKSKEILKQAKESADDILKQVDKKKQLEASKGQSETQNQIDIQKEQLMAKVQTKEDTLRKIASKKKQDGIELVINSILDV